MGHTDPRDGPMMSRETNERGFEWVFASGTSSYAFSAYHVTILSIHINEQQQLLFIYFLYKYIFQLSTNSLIYSILPFKE